VSRYACYRDLFPPRADEHGNQLCRWCGNVLCWGRRSSFCSEQCSVEALVRCGMRVRWAVHRRDRGICAHCGLDCEALWFALRALTRCRPEPHERTNVRRVYECMGLPGHFGCRTLWEAHHIHPVRKGGGGCGLENYETLCWWCHQQETHRRVPDAPAESE
jgi:5-methylcytosine-specific restriction enzyme A